jgi:uncharacterized repeat protein (TIGR03847 family)
VARQVFEYDQPDRFVAGTVGEPGARTFFLQARQGSRLTTVALEKEQVAVLAERIGAVLDEILRISGGSSPVPAATPADLVDNDPLDQPIEEEFRVGTMALSWDDDDGVVVIEARKRVEPTESGGELEDNDEDDENSDALRVRLSGARARAFAERALAIVAAGRPPCPFCGQPLDPAGHVCPRQNGYRRR